MEFLNSKPDLVNFWQGRVISASAEMEISLDDFRIFDKNHVIRGRMLYKRILWMLLEMQDSEG